VWLNRILTFGVWGAAGAGGVLSAVHGWISRMGQVSLLYLTNIKFFCSTKFIFIANYNIKKKCYLLGY
jgi:hypothetical protein